MKPTKRLNTRFGSAEREVKFEKMPKPEKYHLQKLLELRERAKAAAVEVLARKRAQSVAAETELAAREKAAADCRAAQRTAQTAMIEKSKHGIKNSEIIIYRRHLIDLRMREAELLAAVGQQKIVVQRADSEVEKALETLTEMMKELQTIEKHRDNWRREKRVEANRKEQKNNDETSAILHERRKFE